MGFLSRESLLEQPATMSILQNDTLDTKRVNLKCLYTITLRCLVTGGCAIINVGQWQRGFNTIALRHAQGWEAGKILLGDLIFL